ncbi:hypothetical protein BH18ACT15_BH18ACT15_10400 [soil metagenome]
MRHISKEQTKKRLGAAIKRCRMEQGMSRRDLQNVTGRSYPYLSEIEAGKKAPSTEVLGEIAEALGMEMHELLEAAERGGEPRSWGTPRESHFHRTALAPSMPSRGAARTFDSEDHSAVEDPSMELLRIARALAPEDLSLLLDVARRLVGDASEEGSSRGRLHRGV